MESGTKRLKSLLEHPHIFFSGQKFSYVCTNLDEMQIRFELITIKVRDITFVLEYTCIKCLFALNKDIFLRFLVYGVYFAFRAVLCIMFINVELLLYIQRMKHEFEQ